MIDNYFNIILAFITGALVTSGLLPLVLRVAARRNLYDTVDVRKCHTGNVPRLGGLVFAPALGMALLAVVGVNFITHSTEFINTFSRDASVLIFTAIATSIIYLTGIADDLFGVRYRFKFIAQISAGILLCIGGLNIHSLYGVLGIYEIPAWAGIPLTVLMTVFIINAFNLIDGIDGLSGMLTQLTMLVYGTIFVIYGDFLSAFFAAAILGITTPYLYYNIFGSARKGTKIFMGDTGSTSLGLFITALGIRVLQVTDGGSAMIPACNPAILALSPILLPCFDVIRVYFVRIKSGRSPFLPDRNHIHHRFLDLGMSQHTALVSLIGIAILLAGVNIILSALMNINFIFLLDIAVWTVGTSLLVRRIAAARVR